MVPARASFKPGTTLEQILRLYAFDRDLRLLTTDAVERLEIAARSRIVNESCLALGAHWFLDAGHFQPRFNHRDFLEKAEKASGVKIDRRTGAQRLPTTHPETFVTHYYARYGDPYLPPFWMTAELLTLGTLSRVYAASETTLSDRRSPRRSTCMTGFLGRACTAWPICAMSAPTTDASGTVRSPSSHRSQSG